MTHPLPRTVLTPSKCVSLSFEAVLTSLVRIPLVLEPAGWMSTLRVVMGPMNDSSFGIPFVHSLELHFVALSQIRYSWRDIDVVGNEQRLP